MQSLQPSEYRIAFRYHLPSLMAVYGPYWARQLGNGLVYCPMARKTRIRPPERRGDQWELPPCPPHYTCWIGPYGTRVAAMEARVGLERTINSPSWRMMLVELEDEDDFDEQWATMKAKKQSKN